MEYTVIRHGHVSIAWQQTATTQLLLLLLLRTGDAKALRRRERVN
jgi:hypothetical protein